MLLPRSPLPSTRVAAPPVGSLQIVYVVEIGTFVPSMGSLTDTGGSRKGAVRDAGQLVTLSPCQESQG